MLKLKLMPSRVKPQLAGALPLPVLQGQGPSREDGDENDDICQQIT